MKEPNHVMIDLETMATSPNSAIVSIGAVVFDPRTGVITDDTFYEELHWKGQNRHIDHGTKAWWKTQSDHARLSLNGKGDLNDVLEDLAFWLPNYCKVWGNGPTLDIAILENAYNDAGVEVPWKFWNIRCCRTIGDMWQSKRGGIGSPYAKQNSHNALEDAVNQAQLVIKFWADLVKG